MEIFFAKVKISRFWPKTMDYNKAFWPKSRSFFVVLLLFTGRCYEVEICAILFLLRYSFQCYPCLPESAPSVFGRNAWTIVRRFDQIYITGMFLFSSLLLTGRCYETKICAIPLLSRSPFRWYPCFLISVWSFFWPKTMDYNKAFLSIPVLLITLHWKVL